MTERVERDARGRETLHREVRDLTLVLGDGERLEGLTVRVAAGAIPQAHLLLGTDVLSRFGVILDLAPRPFLVLIPEEGPPAP